MGTIQVLGFGATLQQHAYLKICSPPTTGYSVYLSIFQIDHQYGFDRKREGNEWVTACVSCRHTHSHTKERVCETQCPPCYRGAGNLCP